MRTPGSHAREGARESKEAGAQERERAKARAHVRTTERAQERERGEKMRMGVGAGVGVGCRVCVRVWVILHSSGANKVHKEARLLHFCKRDICQYRP